ncbi:MAG: DUF6895 family protein [Myxococcota bacterium]
MVQTGRHLPHAPTWAVSAAHLPLLFTAEEKIYLRGALNFLAQRYINRGNADLLAELICCMRHHRFTDHGTMTWHRCASHRPRFPPMPSRLLPSRTAPRPSPKTFDPLLRKAMRRPLALHARAGHCERACRLPPRKRPSSLQDSGTARRESAVPQPSHSGAASERLVRGSGPALGLHWLDICF